MKRDLDLIRDILLHVEESTSFSKDIFASNLDLAKPQPLDDVYGHIWLLLDESLIVGDLEVYMGNEEAHINIERLTARGHDYLDSVRDPKIWRETKAGLAKAGGTASLAIVQATAVAIFKTSLAKVGIDI